MSSAQPSARIVNHKFLRRGTGIIALNLWWVVQWLRGVEDELTSISISYWTDSGDIFVGSLVAISFFLAAYNGTGENGRDMEFWLSKCAGFFALLVALIPTACAFNFCNNLKDCGLEHNVDCFGTPGWAHAVSLGQAATVHNISAILLFVCLILLIYFFSRRAKSKGKLIRSKFYLAVSLLMLIGMPVLYFIGNKLKWEDTIYWVEVMGLVLFGIGWLVAGSYKTDPEPDNRATHEGSNS